MTTKFMIVLIIVIVGLLFGLYSCNSYRAIDNSKSTNYYYNFYKTKVHYIPMGNWFELGNDKMDSVDVATAVALGEYFLKDKQNVYFKAIQLKNADVNSFQLLDSVNRFYAKDKNTVYFGCSAFEGIDVNSFSFPNEKIGTIIKDKEHVYTTSSTDNYSQKFTLISPIKGLDASRYKSLSDTYGTDDKIAYYEGKAIAGSDANTFTLMGEYAKDANHVYCSGLIISGMDANTLVPVEGGGYYKDKDHVYYGLDGENDENTGAPRSYSGRIVEGADPETFVMVKGEKKEYAKDKKGFYWGGKPE